MATVGGIQGNDCPWFGSDCKTAQIDPLYTSLCAPCMTCAHCVTGSTKTVSVVVRSLSGLILKCVGKEAKQEPLKFELTDWLNKECCICCLLSGKGQSPQYIGHCPFNLLTRGSHYPTRLEPYGLTSILD